MLAIPVYRNKVSTYWLDLNLPFDQWAEQLIWGLRAAPRNLCLALVPFSEAAKVITLVGLWAWTASIEDRKVSAVDHWIGRLMEWVVLAADQIMDGLETHLYLLFEVEEVPVVWS